MSSFRLYVIGLVKQGSAEHMLSVFAEYRAARAISRAAISQNDFNILSGCVRNLKSFVEAGAPEFNQSELKDLGKKLFEILLTGSTRDLLLLATGEQRSGRALLPLEIIAEDPEVASWPWEYLYDANTKKFISQEFHPISRGVFTYHTSLPCEPIDGPIRLLLILGVPPDDLHTTPQEEVHRIRQIFSTQLDTNAFEIDIVNASYEPSEISTKLTSGRPYHIVHYFGHAQFDYENSQGYLAIQKQSGGLFKLDANASQIYSPTVEFASQC